MSEGKHESSLRPLEEIEQEIRWVVDRLRAMQGQTGNSHNLDRVESLLDSMSARTARLRSQRPE